MESRFMLLLIFSEEAPLRRVCGMKGVVRSLLDYVSLDDKWTSLHWMLTHQLDRRTYILTEQNKRYLDDFLQHIHRDFNVSMVQTNVVYTLIDIINCVRVQYINDDGYMQSMLSRLFAAFRKAPFKNNILAQDVYRCYAFSLKTNRFAKKEMSIDFIGLHREGIEFEGIGEDFKTCTVVLKTSRNEAVRLELVLPDDYPFKSPTVKFIGLSRPILFCDRETFRMDQHFTWMCNSVENCLRSILFSMEFEGVCHVY
jgi:hypothetical protein